MFSYSVKLITHVAFGTVVSVLSLNINFKLFKISLLRFISGFKVQDTILPLYFTILNWIPVAYKENFSSELIDILKENFSPTLTHILTTVHNPAPNTFLNYE